MEQKRELEIYIHIPFCVKKCAYCDFLSGPAGQTEQEQYVEALLREIRSFGQGKNQECKNTVSKKVWGYEVVSVFFGGGTPSVLNADWIGKILELLKEKFEFRKDVEISIECNPGTADRKKLEQYRTFGINRISFGLQSADNRELLILGRIHTWEQFQETFQAAREAGFTNINVDLMSALPGQTVSSWKETLEKVLNLEPEHISAYSLIIEEGTPFYEKYAADARLREEGEVPHYLPSEEAEREMYCLTEELLLAAGMHRYEISNYAKQGYECRHNVGYWTGTEYIGFGLGASSYLKHYDVQMLEDEEAVKGDNVFGEYSEWPVYAKEGGPEQITVVRIQNTADMENYLAEDFEHWKEIPKNIAGILKNQEAYLEMEFRIEKILAESLSVEDQMSEFMFLGLRLMDGVSEAEFRHRFRTEIDSVYGEIIKRQCELGLLKREKGRIFLTKTGIDLSNAVMAEFLL